MRKYGDFIDLEDSEGINYFESLVGPIAPT